MIFKKILEQKIIFPFLFTVYPVVFLLSFNIGKSDYAQAIFPGVVIISSSIILYLFLRRFIKDRFKSGLLVGWLFLSFFTYGHLYDLAAANLNSNLGRILVKPSYGLIFWMLLNVLIIYKVLVFKKAKHPLILFFNIFSLFLILFSLANIAIYELSQFLNPTSEDFRETSDDGKFFNLEDLPDIYYIILDGNASASVLKDLYGYDNKSFVSFLRKNKFFVSESAKSNYVMTSLSLASSLNMKYVNYLSEELGKNSREEIRLHKMIEDNDLVKLLKDRGYKYVTFSSGWGPTNYSRLADVNFQKVFLSEFSTLLIRKSAIGHFEFTRPFLRSRILFTFENLKKIERDSRPKFVFAHILIPHPPWLFGPRGERVEGTEITLTGDDWTEKEKYIGQVRFAEIMIKDVIKTILSGNKESVLIVQADHGPSSTLREEGRIHLQERFGILNAIYIPEKYEKNVKLYEGMTPVNTFRMILNTIFNENYAILEDRHYYTDVFRPFDFSDVTGELVD